MTGDGALPAETADFATLVDHTVLGPTVGPDAVERAVSAAREWGTHLCVPPWAVSRVADRLPDAAVLTVIDFPHGQGSTAGRRRAVAAAAEAGADEVDVPLNLGRFQDGDRAAVRDDIAAVADAASVPVTVIVHAPRLDPSALRAACDLADDAGAAFVKTATGFGPGGATAAAVEVMAESLPVKASGGVDDLDDAAALLAAGADRIGASAGAALVAAHADRVAGGE
ncbi:MAG: deoxyribose-phosphate aldolase [Halobacteriaceae archaeon]